MPQHMRQAIYLGCSMTYAANVSLVNAKIIIFAKKTLRVVNYFTAPVF